MAKLWPSYARRRRSEYAPKEVGHVIDLLSNEHSWWRQYDNIINDLIANNYTVF